jgi:polar amino acid transport system substrate-binding protein
VKFSNCAFAAVLLLCFARAFAAPGELVLIAPSNHTMPLAQFEGGQLRAGILKDLGEVLAAKLGRSVRFVVVPGRRVAIALAQGKADGVCMVKPGWIDGDFQWSAELIPTGGVVLARADAPVMMRLTDLRGKKVGTVGGYRYAMPEAVLGKDFLRDDAPSTEHSRLKLLAGRTQYALMELLSAAYLVKNDATGSLRLDITYEHGMARCAFSRLSQVPFVEVRRAIDSMIAGHSVNKIVAQYR